MADTKNTQKMSPQGYNYYIPDYNENPWYDEDEAGERPSELPIASKTQAGIVKIGDGVNVSDDGTISVENGGGGGSAKTPVITASASVSDTVGTPSVDVIKTGTDENPNFEFSFSNLKGERGERGEQGESITGPQGPKGDPGESITGPQGPAGEAGYSPTATVIQDEDGATITITSKPGDVEETTTAKVKNGSNGKDGQNGKDGVNGVSPTATVSQTETGATISITDASGTTTADITNGKNGADGSPGKDGENGISPTVNATGSTESGALAGTITGADGNVINVYNGARGEKGETGSGGETPTIDTTNVVNNVSMTNENGVYTLSQSKGDPASPTTTEIGTIEVPKVDTDNLLAEVKDNIVSNDTSGYDYHTIQETENNGTQNDVSKFYLAQKQITDISATGNQLNVKTVNQAGTEETKSVEVQSVIPNATADTLGGILLKNQTTAFDGQTVLNLQSATDSDGNPGVALMAFSKEAGKSVVSTALGSVVFKGLNGKSYKLHSYYLQGTIGRNTLDKETGARYTIQGILTDANGNQLDYDANNLPIYSWCSISFLYSGTYYNSYLVQVMDINRASLSGKCYANLQFFSIPERMGGRWPDVVTGQTPYYFATFYALEEVK